MKTSIMVPAYNEENRIRPFLRDLLAYAKNLKNYEIIFVNDGSTDQTLGIIRQMSKGNKNVVVISYTKNKGKGAAVQKGVQRARGEKILFIDADGSIDPTDIGKMLQNLEHYDVVVGSRVQRDSVVIQPAFRKFTGVSFNTYANLLFGIRIRDTLCGFKGFRKEIAKELFNGLVSMRWVFDVELFYKIRKSDYSLYEQPLTWVYKKDSKMSIIDPFKMAVELIKLRFRLQR